MNSCFNCTCEKLIMNFTAMEKKCQRSASQEAIVIYTVNKEHGSLVRSKTSELNFPPVDSNEIPSAKEVADKLGVSVERVHTGRFGDALGCKKFAVVKNGADSGLLHVFLAASHKNLPLLVAVDPKTSAVDVTRMVLCPRKRSPQSQLCLLREGQVLSNASLADNGVQELNVLQWVKVEEKVMDVIHYQKPDVRRKFHPKVPNTCSIGDIKDVLSNQVVDGNLRFDIDSDELILTAGHGLFLKNDFRPHMDVMDINGKWMSRKIIDRYFTFHIFPKETPRRCVLLTYRRGCDKNMKARKTVVIVPEDSSIETVRANVTRFVSIKPGHSVRLCDKDGNTLRASSQETLSSLPGMVKDAYHMLYAELEPDMMVFVDVTSDPSGGESCVVTHCRKWDTVDDLQNAVAEKLDTSPDLLSLCSGAERLQRDSFIHDYKICDRCRVQCTFYERGKIACAYSADGARYDYLIKDKTATTVEDLESRLSHSSETVFTCVSLVKEQTSRTLAAPHHGNSGPHEEGMGRRRSLIQAGSHGVEQTSKAGCGQQVGHFSRNRNDSCRLYNDRFQLLKIWDKDFVRCPFAAARQESLQNFKSIFDNSDRMEFHTTAGMSPSESIHSKKCREGANGDASEHASRVWKVPSSARQSAAETLTACCSSQGSLPDRQMQAFQKSSLENVTLPSDTSRTAAEDEAVQLRSDVCLAEMLSETKLREKGDIDSAVERASYYMEVNKRDGSSVVERQTKSLSYKRKGACISPTEKSGPPRRKIRAEEPRFQAEKDERGSDVTSEVSDQTLSDVASELCHDWSKVCLDLGVAHRHIVDIESRARGNLYKAAFEGLCKWRQREGRKASVQKLMEVLRRNDLHSIAEKLA